MDRSKDITLIIVGAVAVGGLACLLWLAPRWFAGNRAPATPPAAAVAPPAPAPAPEAAKPATKPAAPKSADRTPSTGAMATTNPTMTSAAPVESAPAVALPPSPSSRGRATAAAPPRESLDAFVAANAARWTRFDINVNAPTLLRAGGEMAFGAAEVGPDGFTAASRANLLLAAAPYMALIGRVCGLRECSKPFAIGRRTVVCPAVVGTGSLELWTNNRVGTGGAPTPGYSQASGGFYVYAEAAPPATCAEAAGPMSLSEIASSIPEGRTLDRPEFVISSRQGAWKPFFVPLGQPLRIRAVGEVRPGENVAGTDPDGIVVPNVASWSYPGTSQVVVDREHPLFDPRFPYQALIGRVCGPSECGPTVFVGRERTICAPPALRDHLELWINNIPTPRGLIGQTMPLTLHTLGVQTRSGEYRFNLTAMPAAACGDAGAPR